MKRTASNNNLLSSTYFGMAVWFGWMASHLLPLCYFLYVSFHCIWNWRSFHHVAHLVILFAFGFSDANKYSYRAVLPNSIGRKICEALCDCLNSWKNVINWFELMLCVFRCYIYSFAVCIIQFWIVSIRLSYVECGLCSERKSSQLFKSGTIFRCFHRILVGCAMTFRHVFYLCYLFHMKYTIQRNV